MEATLTPLMEQMERDFIRREGVQPAQRRPSRAYGRHIELGVKGAPDAVAPAFDALVAGLSVHGAQLGPEMVR